MKGLNMVGGECNWYQENILATSFSKFFNSLVCLRAKPWQGTNLYSISHYMLCVCVCVCVCACVCVCMCVCACLCIYCVMAIYLITHMIW